MGSKRFVLCVVTYRLLVSSECVECEAVEMEWFSVESAHIERAARQPDDFLPLASLLGYECIVKMGFERQQPGS